LIGLAVSVMAISGYYFSELVIQEGMPTVTVQSDPNCLGPEECGPASNGTGGFNGTQAGNSSDLG
jgi:hypothetical protein